MNESTRDDLSGRLDAVIASLFLVVRTLLAVPIAGSPAPPPGGRSPLPVLRDLRSGIFLGTITRSLAQFAPLIILLIIVLQLLSGGNTPIESQPGWMQRLTLVLPSRHFVAFSQAIIYRGAGLETVWPQFLAVTGIGPALFVLSLRLFRQSVVADVVTAAIQSLDLKYPEVTESQREPLTEARRRLAAE